MEDRGGSAGNLREGKQYTFEGGMHVPTVAMWKAKIPAKTVYSKKASQMDWFPTIAAITGQQLPKDRAIGGCDISNVLFGKGERSKDTYLYLDGKNLQCYRNGQWKVKIPFKGFKQVRWKSGVAAHDTLLFDLEKDPVEKNNLYPENKKKAQQLLREMEAEYDDIGKLPPSLILKSNADESHYKNQKNIKNK